MTVVLESRDDFTLDNYRRVALGGESIRLSPAAKKAIASARKSFIAMLDSDRTQFVYGTTTTGGMGAKVQIPPAEQRQRAQDAALRRRLTGGRSFGGGHLPDRVVRGIIFARLANFIEGNAKTRPVIAERFAQMLDGRPLPKLPLYGNVVAGETGPLAHILEAYPEGDYEEAEPMALINGSPCAAALIADVALQARNRLANAERAFALSIEAFNAPLVAYDADLEQLWGTAYESEALRALNGYLKGVPRRGRRFYQAPVSYRILPRVLANAHRAVEQVEEAARVSLRSVSDNPVYVLPTKARPLGYAVSTGGYHNGMAYPAMDRLSSAWADLVALAERHVNKMANPEVSGLPPGLVRPGMTGFGAPFGFAQVHFGEAARHAAERTFIPMSETPNTQDDTAVPTFFAYEKNAQAGWYADAATAMLAAVASQALWASDRNGPPALDDFLATVRTYFPPLDQTGRRRPGAEVERLAKALGESTLSGKLEPPGARNGRARAAAGGRSRG
jgi:histidine ammonia-lyase